MNDKTKERLLYLGNRLGTSLRDMETAMALIGKIDESVYNLKPGKVIAVDDIRSFIHLNDDENKRLREKVQRQRRELRRLNKTLKAMWDGVRFSANAEVVENTRFREASARRELRGDE